MALEVERRAYLERHAAALDADGHRLVVGNGYHQAREITTAAGCVPVLPRRCDDRRTGERYLSALLPLHMRRLPTLRLPQAVASSWSVPRTTTRPGSSSTCRSG
ncbi:MAG: hypothetical protein OXN86_12200 [Chloroflexota bacterium]|nr:hypothetical protein [Chloroflexota bacterium]